MQRPVFAKSKVLNEDIEYLKLQIQLLEHEIKLQLRFGYKYGLATSKSQLMKIQSQRSKLEALAQSHHEPIFYTSIKTGETVYNAPAKVDSSQQTKPAATLTSRDNLTLILFGNKQPRLSQKLKAQKRGQQPAAPERCSSTIKLEKPDGSLVATLDIQHKLPRLDGRKKYPSGGTSTKVKLAVNRINNEKRAIKTYIDSHSQEKFRLRALRSKYFCEKVLKQPSEVCSHGGQLTFITQWHKPLRISAIQKLPVVEQLQFLLDITHQVALFHQLDLVLNDLKRDNFVYTKDGAKMIDLDAVMHLRELRSINLSVVATAQYLDDEGFIAHIIEGDLKPHLITAGKSLDVYLLGVLFIQLLTSIRNYEITARENTDIAYFVRTYPEYARLCKGIKSTKTPEAANHPELDALIDDLTNSDRTKRPASAVEVYQRLRLLVLDNKYLAAAPLRINDLPSITKADSDAVLKDLQFINKEGPVDNLPAIQRCNNDVSFHQNTPDNAVRYDYQTLKNIKFREKVLQLGPAKVNDLPAADSSFDDTNSTANQTKVTHQSTPVTINERPPVLTNNNLQTDRIDELYRLNEQSNRYDTSSMSSQQKDTKQNRTATTDEHLSGSPSMNHQSISNDELQKLNDQFKRFVAFIIYLTPNIKANHGKYHALKKFNDIVKNINPQNPVSSDELTKLAKNFFHLSLSHIRFDLFNTTETGLKCRTVLADPYFKDLTNFLFPERNPENAYNDAAKRKLTKEGVRYRDIRRFVCGNEKNTKFFSHHNTKTDIGTWEQRPQYLQQTAVTQLANFKFRD